ncbi:MAG TPA: lysine--tRNA ligase [Euryarchaeota archaeon]|nr:lysine--tRNA ligase [Euryarchaeota archaeon]
MVDEADTTEKDLRRLRKEKLEKIVSMGVDPYKYRFCVSDEIAAVKKRHADIGEEKSEEKVTLAGRVMGTRLHGKAGFADILGQDDKIQAYFKKNAIGEESFELYKLLETGDIIGVTGPVFRTRMGEITVWVERFDLLTKSLMPFPEKYHGLQNVELRYRKRYLDLISNPEVRKTFVMRSKIISHTRNYLDSRGYLEVETPILQPLYGGAFARPFVTYHNYLDVKLYLRIAPELYLKKLSVGGLEKIYEIGKSFRNEDIDAQHNPEYTLLELYEAYSDYNGMMDLTESLICDIIEKQIGEFKLPFGDRTIDFTPPWKRMTMADAIREFSDVDVSGKTGEELLEIAKELNVPDVTDDMLKGELIGEIFDTVAQPKLIDPIFVINHPADISPLARRLKEDPDFSERFELFINGWEIANAFTELTDPAQQLENLQRQSEQREKEGEAHPIDQDFIDALECGLPPTGGLGIGMDRLVMLLTDSRSIKDVLFFPQMRPKSGEGDSRS